MRCRLPAILLLVAGCATVSPPRPDHQNPGGNSGVLSVPFLAQKPNYCGPAALAMVAAYYGKSLTQDDVADAIRQPGVRGVLTSDLAEYARRLGFWVRVYRGNLADLRQKLAAGIPLILCTRFGESDHLLVALGTDNFRRTITVHSDTRPQLELPQEDFLRYWERGGRWTLLVCPPDRIPWRMSADEHNDLGVFLERRGQHVAAAGHYRMATELQPNNPVFHLNLGNALLKQNLFSEAAAAYRRAVELAPDDANAMNNLAWAYCELGANLEEAAALCRRAAALQPARCAYYLDTLGSVLLKQGKTKEAVQAFETALAATTSRQTTLRDAIRQRLQAAQQLLVPQRGQ